MFRLTDSTINSLVPGVANTAGNAVYLARGTIETRQAQINAVRHGEIVTDTVDQHTNYYQRCSWYTFDTIRTRPPPRSTFATVILSTNFYIGSSWVVNF